MMLVLNKTTLFSFLLAFTFIVKDGSSNQGTEFLLAFPQSNSAEGNINEKPINVYVTLVKSNHGTVDDVDINFILKDPEEEHTSVVTEQDPVTLFQSSKDRVFPFGNVQGQKYLMRVIATSNVTVVVRNGRFEEVSNLDTYLAIPVPQLGNTYVAFAYTSVLWISSSFIVLAAGNRPASINITLPGESNETAGIKFEYNNIEYTNGDRILVNLAAYEACQLQFIRSDVTGALIESDTAIAVWSGNNRTRLTKSIPGNSHAIEQVPPTSMMGKKFVACSSCNENPHNIYRVVNIYTNTDIIVHSPLQDTKSYSLSKAGSVLQLSLPNGNEVSYIETSKPSTVYYFSIRLEAGLGDGYLMVIPPLGVPMPSEYTFQLNAEMSFTVYISFVINRTTVRPKLNGYPLAIAAFVYMMDITYHSIAGNSDYIVGCLKGSNPSLGTYSLQQTFGTPFIALYEEAMSFEGFGHPLSYGLTNPVPDYPTGDGECCTTVNTEGMSLFDKECPEIDRTKTCCTLDYQTRVCEAKSLTATCEILQKTKLSTRHETVLVDTALACHIMCYVTSGCLGVNVDGTTSVSRCQMLFGSILGLQEISSGPWLYLDCSTTVTYQMDSI